MITRVNIRGSNIITQAMEVTGGETKVLGFCNYLPNIDLNHQTPLVSSGAALDSGGVSL